MSYLTGSTSSSFPLFGSTAGGTSPDAGLATSVGQKFTSSDGREFVLVQNGAVALLSGRLVQGPASIGATHSGLVLSTQAVGDKQITATLGATLVTANQYAGGYLVVNAGGGIGQTVRIASHPAAAALGTVVLTLEDPLSVATVTATSTGSLTLNPYGSANGTAFSTHGVVISPVAATGTTVGVTIYPIPATTATVLSYGFIQTKGFVGCLNDANTAIGLDLMPSSGTAGAVVTYVAATRNRIGTSTIAGVTTEVRGITLQL